MTRHRDDRDFGESDAEPVFVPLEREVTLTLQISRAARYTKRYIGKSIDVDVSEFAAPEVAGNALAISRAPTEPIPEDTLTACLRAMNS